jgi:hypothetical protein
MDTATFFTPGFKHPQRKEILFLQQKEMIFEATLCVRVPVQGTG